MSAVEIAIASAAKGDLAKIVAAAEKVCRAKLSPAQALGVAKTIMLSVATTEVEPMRALLELVREENGYFTKEERALVHIIISEAVNFR